VHDVARPFAPPAVTARVLAAAQKDGAASAVLDVADTLHDATGDRAVARDALRLVQTPQAFARALLQRAHERARAAGLRGTDDAQLVRALPHAVTLVAGSPLSHKLTGPADLELLEALAHGLGFAAPRDVAPR
jgi:2-C-methyl-D-erythritol 4-phosphate cytidylyltransferase